MSDSETSQELACPHCGGRLEAAAKVYFDLTAADRCADGALAITGLEFSGLNDSFDGHPVAMEAELGVSCAGCGYEPAFTLAGTAVERTSFRGGTPMGPRAGQLRTAREMEVRAKHMAQTNVVERLEHLVAALMEAHAAVERSEPSEANARIDDAEGIAGEIRTMLTERRREGDLMHFALSAIAYRTICGLVQPSDVIDAEEVFAADVVWAEIRSIFPAADSIEGEVDEEEPQSLFTVIGTYTDAEEDGEPQRFGEAVTAVSAEEAEGAIRAEHPTLLVAGVLSGGMEVIR